MTLFVIDVTFNPAQVFVTLFLAFPDSSDVTASDGNIGDLASLAFAVEARILLSLTQSLP